MEQKIILLADDDSDDTEMFREALSEINSTSSSISAINGRELLKVLHELPTAPQLIFLDVNMPVMNGWECLTYLKESETYKNIPVIMISTSSHRGEIDKAIMLGALCYFVKPHDFNDLTRLLQVITTNSGDHLKEALQKLQKNGSSYIFTCQSEV